MFVKLLNTFVKEDNPKIDSFHVWSLGAVDTNMYVIQVMSYYDLERSERVKIQSDITKVFNIIGFGPGSNFMIQYKKLG